MIPSSAQLRACAQNRKNLLANYEDEILIIPGNFLRQKNSDVHYLFRQDSDFNYLCAYPEADSILVLDTANQSFTLFVPPKDPLKELWDGPRHGIEGAKDLFEADQAYSHKDLAKQLPHLIGNRKVLYHLPHFLSPLLDELNILLETYSESMSKEGLRTQIHDLRIIKNDFDLDCMRKSAQVSSMAHKHLMQSASKYSNESQLDAEFRYFCAMNGQPDMAYPPIVAAGANATCLHYILNDQPYKDSDCILVDGGSSYLNYAADITRVFPAKGKFSPAAKELYQATLRVQKQVFAKINTESSLFELNSLTQELSCQELCDLGIIKASFEEAMEKKLFRTYVPHGVSHHLGLDVHDVSDSSFSYRNTGKVSQLKSGMVVTIEPGIYIPKNDQTVDPYWRGIGIRIEDDIHVLENSYENLTASCPKEIDEIEELQS
ncbi:aminopeptidase P family protein [Lentisphaera profundi]|uniref:Xaa-Pro aminopeptidase n=1 Tax=Lentisphaera profundi TaxID=1658616 RepID=A0ABY7VXR3_9BACT|nr:aminopeptidase P family protein [Lentisphaera profundi]WDE97494.1 aminopeptidase P family protein [Lentisphaera profundi]